MFHIGLITVLFYHYKNEMYVDVCMLLLQVSGKYSSYINQLIFVTSRGRFIMAGRAAQVISIILFPVHSYLYLSPELLFILFYFSLISYWFLFYLYWTLQVSFNFYAKHPEAELKLLSGRHNGYALTSLAAHWGSTPH